MKFSFLSQHSTEKIGHEWRTHSKTYLNPVRDWSIGLLVGVFMFVLGGTIIAYDFYEQFGVPNQKIVVEQTPLIYQEALIREYAEAFNTIEGEFIRLRGVRALPQVEEAPVQIEEEKEEVPLPSGVPTLE